MDTIALEILEKVNNFYTTSFSQLLTITLGLVAFVGIFVPILTTYYQNRNIKLEKENLEDFISNKIEAMKLEVIKDIKEELLAKLTEFEGKQKEQIEKVIAGVFHVQASHQIGKGAFKNATNSILSAINSCIKGNDELNLQRGLKLLITQCLPNITKEEELNIEALEETIVHLQSDMEKLNINGRYSDTLNDVIKAKNKLIKQLSEP